MTPCQTSHPLRAVLRVRQMAHQAQTRQRMDLPAKVPLPSDSGTSDSSSDSSSSSSESSSSSGSEPSSPVRASTPRADTADGQQEQFTPKTADTSMQARQFYGEMLGRPLTRKEFKRPKEPIRQATGHSTAGLPKAREPVANKRAKGAPTRDLQGLEWQ